MTLTDVDVDEELVRALLSEQFPALDASSARLLAAGVLPCIFILGLQSRRLDQYCFSPELAEGRGVAVNLLLWTVFFFGSLLTTSWLPC